MLKLHLKQILDLDLCRIIYDVFIVEQARLQRHILNRPSKWHHHTIIPDEGLRWIGVSLTHSQRAVLVVWQLLGE